MRAPFVVAVSFAALMSGVAVVHAADLSPRLTERWSSYELEPQQPAGQILIYDYEPGVVVRAWWAPPWRNRHYFPSGSIRQAQFRPERRRPPQRAERYKRSWSTCSVCTGEQNGPYFIDPRGGTHPQPYRGRP